MQIVKRTGHGTRGTGRIVLALCLAGWSATAPAASYTWDADGTPPASGGTGAWDVTATRWYDGAANVAWPTNGLDNDAIFTNAAGTVTISGSVTANDLTFDTTGYSVQGGTLTLNGATPTLTARTGVTATIGSALAGSGLVKAGGGTLTLGGALGYTGATLVNGGTLLLRNVALPATGTITNNATLTHTVSNNGYPRVITATSGPGTWIVDGSGAGNVWQNRVGFATAASTATGPIQVTATGRLWDEILTGQGTGIGPSQPIVLLAPTAAFYLYGNAGQTIAVGSLQGSGFVDFFDGGAGKSLTLSIGGDNSDQVFGGSIRNSGGSTGPTVLALLKIGSGTQTLAGANTYSGGTSITGGVLSVDQIADAGTSRIGVTGAGGNYLALKNGTLRYTGAGTNSTSRYLWIDQGTGTFDITQATGTLALSPAGGTVNRNVTKTGAGTLVLNGAVSGTAAVTVNGGTLTLGGASTYSGGTTISDGVLTLAGAPDRLPAGGALTLAGGATAAFALNNFNQTVGALSGGGAIRLGTATLTVNQAAATTYAGAIGGSGGLAKSGAGTLTLAGANTYTGATSINGGTLALGAADSLADSATIAVAAGARLDVTAAAGFSLGAGQTLQGSGTVTGAVTAVAGARLQPGGAATAGTLTFGNDLTLADGVTNVFDLATATTAGGGVNDLVSVNGNLAAGGRIVVNALRPLTGGGSYRLFTYRGSKSGAFAGVVVTGTRYSGTLDETTGGQINLVVGGEASNLVWSGGTNSAWDIDASANWNSNSLTYFNVDSVTFDDTSTNRTVSLAGTLTPAAVTVSSATNYFFGGTGHISGRTGLTKTGSGTLTLLTLNDYAGGTRIGGGTLAVGDGGAASIGGAVTNDGSLVFNHAQALTLGGRITGSGSLTKRGAGTLTLAPATPNTYAGGTVVNGGALLLQNVAMPAVGAITNNATIFHYVSNNGYPRIVTATAGSGAWVIDGSGAGNVWQNRVGFATAVSTATGPIQVTATGKLWEETYAGQGTGIGPAQAINLLAPTAAFYIYGNAGQTIAIGSLQGSGFVDFFDGGAGKSLTLAVGGDNSSQVFSGSIRNSGGSSGPTVLGLRKVGAGTQTLSGASTYSGGTWVAGGALAAGNNAAFGAGAVTLSGATLTTDNAQRTLANAIVLAAATTNTIASGGAAFANYLQLNGNLSGAGTVTLASGGATLRLNGDNSGFSGRAIVTGSTYLPNAAAGSAGAVWEVNGGGLLGLLATSGTIRLGALDGSGGTLWNDQALGNALTFAIGDLSRNAAYSGTVQDSWQAGRGTVALLKTGAGTQTLGGINTYSGGTTVNAGTLLVNNPSGSGTGTGAVAVRAGGKLGGTGSVGGNVTVEAGGGLTPGSAGVGTLHVQGDLALAQAAGLDWDFTPAAADAVAVAGTLTLPASLELSVNLIQPGRLDGATLFTYGAYSGPAAVALTVDGEQGLYLAEDDGGLSRIVLRATAVGTVLIVR